MLTRTKIEAMKGIPLMREMTAEELGWLARTMEERDFKKDEVIFGEGEVPGLFYIILDGEIEITKKTSAGHRQVIAILKEGRFFGELSFFEKRRHSAQALAMRETRLLMLHKFNYDELEKEQPLLIHKMLREIILVLSANLDSMNDLFLHMIHYAFYGGKAGAIEMPEV
ncbi:MAG TPA: cyclic nucleotide-binding domain-containing protein [Nitrospiria bacterium]